MLSSTIVATRRYVMVMYSTVAIGNVASTVNSEVPQRWELNLFSLQELVGAVLHAAWHELRYTSRCFTIGRNTNICLGNPSRNPFVLTYV